MLLLPFRIEKLMRTLFFPLSGDGTRLAWKKGKKQIQLEKKVKGVTDLLPAFMYLLWYFPF